MGREAVRAAVQSYLDPAASGISHLGTVYAHPAKISPEGDFYANDDPGTDSGAVIYIYLGHSSSKRISLRGNTAGGKLRSYDLVLDCFIRSNAPTAQEAGAFSDQFLDELIARIEADKTAGTGRDGTIFTWGEGSSVGAPDIEVTAMYPRPIKGKQSTTQVWAQIRLTVLETA